MAKDPAFLFYPGDYLRDTQMLSEKTQVSYDRIMCEHMRNICISQKQLNFLTKKLTEDEVSELMMMLSKVNGGFQIEWVADSISKRKAYSESRRKNREKKPKKDMINTSSTYDKHMENEIEDEIVIKGKSKTVKEKVVFPFDSDEFKTWWGYWKEYKSKEHKFKYASHISEQASVKELADLSNGNEDLSIKIIEQSIAKGWKGFFELKSDTKKYNSDPASREAMRKKIGAEFARKWKHNEGSREI